MTHSLRLAGRLAATTFRPLGRLSGALCGLASEATSLAVALALLLLVLAQPAMRMTRGEAGLTPKPLGLSVTILDRAGRELGQRGILHDDRLALADLSPHLVQAVLATEDSRFWRHWGLDPVGLGRALVADLKARALVQGGSTISQQLAKSWFLTGERTLDRKITEALLAVWLETHLGKPAILKSYLDRSYLGGNAYGVGAASRLYYGKSAAELTLAEAASLAAILKSPARYAPGRPGGAGNTRTALVLDRMLALGLIDRAARDAALAEPAAPRRPAVASSSGHALDFAFREVQRLAATKRIGPAAGGRGPAQDLVVETSLDAALQSRAEEAVATRLARDGRRLRVGEGAAIVMEPNGAVRALVGGRDHARSQFDRATDAVRQPGSAFKPIVYLAALAFGRLNPDSIVRDEPICIAGWCPSNFSHRFSGPMSLASALAASINTVAVGLSVEIGDVAGESGIVRKARAGRTRIAQVARALGLSRPLPDAPSLPLGSSGLTLAELSAAYAAIANGGLRVEPHAVQAIRSAGDGGLVYTRPTGPGPRALAPDLVADIAGMLRRVVVAGSGRRAGLARHPVAGKTGTSSGFRDAWFVGFSGQLVGGVWYGNDDYTPTLGVTGGMLPAETWHDIMESAHAGLPPVALWQPAPSDLTAGGSRPASGSGHGLRPVESAPGGRGFEVLSATGARFGW